MIKIEYLEEEIPVYDITVEKNHNFYANGILVHNCTEILLPTIPLNSLEDPEGEIALCILSAGNMGKIKSDRDAERVATLAVRGLDALIDYQTYLLPASANATLNRRSLGIGLTNFAYWLAKNDQSYSNPDYESIDQFVEAWSYYVTKASVDLAEERGPCPKWKETKYSLGLTPNLTYKKDVDKLVPHQERKPWGELRERIKTVGIRNSTLFCHMPSETSSQLTNATNGLNPIPSLITVKKSGDGVLRQAAPDLQRLKNKYELKFDVNAEDVIKINSIFHKYNDQAISTNTPYDPSKYDKNELPLSIVVEDILTAYKYGLATLYYNETNDNAGEATFEDLEVETETENEIEECEACSL